MIPLRCRSAQIPCYHYILTPNSDTYPYCLNKIVVIVGLCNQGLRICNTQTTQLSINIMQVTYAQLFKFMGTFTNQELDDAQTIAEYAHQDLGKSYNQVLVDVLVEMRQHQLAN